MSRHPQASSLCREDFRTSISFHVSYSSYASRTSSSRRSASPAPTIKESKYNLRPSTQLDQPGLKPPTSALARKASSSRGIASTEIDKSNSEKIKRDDKIKRRSSWHDSSSSGIPSHSPTSMANHAKSRAVARTPTIQDLKTRQILESFQEEEDEAEEKESLRSRRIPPREAMLHRAPPISKYKKARSLASIPSESTICGGDSDCETWDSLGDDVDYGNLCRYKSLNDF